jgi:hypothetical protein
VAMQPPRVRCLRRTKRMACLADGVEQQDRLGGIADGISGFGLFFSLAKG